MYTKSIMESLGKLFGSQQRIKIMRLFLFNENEAFDANDVIKRSMVKRADVRKEINLLLKIGFLSKKSFSKKIPKKPTKKNPNIDFKTLKTKGWILNYNFDLIKPLRSLLINSELVKNKDITKRLKKSGTIKLLILSGLFIQDFDRNLDILVVGDKLKRDLLKREITKLESEIGRELSYAVFDSSEFDYRIKMYDKLVRDVIENNHMVLVDKILY